VDSLGCLPSKRVFFPHHKDLDVTLPHGSNPLKILLSLSSMSRLVSHYQRFNPSPPLKRTFVRTIKILFQEKTYKHYNLDGR